MIKGIGIDIIELNRVEAIIERQPHFVDRVLTDREKESFSTLSQKRKVEFLAGRFSAKEAYSKALGTGIGKQLSFLDIEVIANENGKPYINSKEKKERIHLSISHSQEYVVAQVLIEEIHT